jgi:hypothetical protein
MNSDSYVYIYLDTRKSGKFIYYDLEFDYEPFYVGKGCGDRYNNHLNEKKVVNRHKSGKIENIKKVGLLPKIVFICDSVSDDVAKSIEMLTISKIGRYPNGPLTNLTNGGDGAMGFNRSKDSIDKQIKSTLSNHTWLTKMKSPEFAAMVSERMTEYYSNDENKKLISKRQSGSGNSMYGKKTSDNQKNAVRLAHSDGRIKLSDDGRKRIIYANKKRKGKKNNKIKSDAIFYILFSPNGESYNIFGNVRLQEFCKQKKLQLHVLKEYINITISGNLVTGNRIFARNTIGWKLKIND